MMHKIAHYRRSLQEKGLGGVISSRWKWYKQRVQMDNWLVGRAVELFGNKIALDGITLSVDNPLITTKHKCTLYFGIYEVGARVFTKRYIDRSIPTIEIGGSIGGVACTTNRLLRQPSQHVILECNPLVLPTLERNREINKCQFWIEPVALAYDSATVTFSIASDHFMHGRLHAVEGKLVTVPTATLRQIIAKYKFETVNLISNSEGAEIEMVENDADILRDHVKTIIIETHADERGHDLVSKMMARLHEIGFRIAEQRREMPVFALINARLDPLGPLSGAVSVDRRPMTEP